MKMATTLRPETSRMPINETHSRYLSLVQGHQKLLHKLAYVYCRRAEDRRDLIQEMLIQLWKSFDSFDGRVQFSTWMYRVAMNVAISFYRSERRATHALVSLDEFDLDISVVDDAFQTDTDNMRSLKTLIDQLDEINRALIIMFLDGSSHDEIGAVLGISASNVGTRLGRLKQKLKDSLA
jgi:RNA polymerase sigma factor (sigma-70 family)